ncbi:protoporphyrinogen oxidase [Persicimonas caeni]|uniref:Coproporphyrinogen III oxidase n=1 Tax=Persicimonas caeni TaxID=2292766 RepID=A0A4Y6Q0Y9_PERCE|nr:protoporphyrinogen oxidase [Persicimonas caeni]QDG54241.1 protoporphyrinogen oxidase [Persicimonas caeni]QED35462.1 protoporphyrinogen oxidase [Persicimonas caeni]
MAASDKTIAVIGAGITGLTTAFKLRQAGFDVVIFEASGHVGGQIRTKREDGYLLETGPHTLLGRDKLPTLVDELGLRGRMIEANSEANKRYLVRYGKPHAAPMDPISFLKTQLLSPLAKLRLFVEPFIPPGNRSDESLADFVTRRLGPEPLEFAVGPLVAGTFAGDPGKLSVKHAFPKLFNLEREHGSLVRGLLTRVFEGRKDPQGKKKTPRPKLISFDEGSQVLTGELETRLEDHIERESRVYSLEKKSNGRWLVRFRQSDKRRQKTVDAVVSTIPTHALAEVELDGAEPFAPLDDVYYPPVSILAMGFRCEDVEHPLDGFGMLIPAEERRSILGTLFMSTLFPGRAPDGQVLLTSFVGGARDPELALEDKSILVERALADLDDLLGLRGQPQFTEHIVWKKAIPQYEVGYARFHEIMDDLEADNPGLFLVGNFRNGIAVPDLVTAGYEAAERISQFIS